MGIPNSWKYWWKIKIARWAHPQLPKFKFDNSTGTNLEVAKTDHQTAKLLPYQIFGYMVHQYCTNKLVASFS